MIWTFLIVSTGLVSAYETVHPQRLSELRAAGEYEEYARLLGIDDVDLVRPSNDERSEVIDMRSRPVSPLGDIMLTKEQSEQARLIINFNRYPASKWPNCTMHYYIEEPDFSKDQVRIINEAIQDFNRISTGLQLKPHPQTGDDDIDYVYAFSGSGCWSYLGRTGGAQALSLQNNGCVYAGTIQHEFMHAAGVHHEQNRADRDEHIEMLWDNIPTDWHSQYEKQDPAVFVPIRHYDYYSVMHYPKGAPGTGKDAFLVKKSGIDENRIGRAQRLSDIDVQKLGDIYRKEG